MTMALAPEKQARCVFEYIYFARPDSHIDGVSVYGSRIKAGRFLTMDSPVEADIVTGVPGQEMPLLLVIHLSQAFHMAQHLSRTVMSVGHLSNLSSQAVNQAG